jgi:imidazolonepropionase-like amidohydrolase
MKLFTSYFLLIWYAFAVAQNPNQIVIQTGKVFTGETIESDWSILIEGHKIIYAGPAEQLYTLSDSAIYIDLRNYTTLPGLIEGHAHLFLHPYNETSWNDQVLNESSAERTIRAAVHARKNLMAGFTSVRDLGTEGSGYDDVGLKTAIEKGIIPGPRLTVAGKAIVSTGSYGPKGFAPHVKVPLGAEAADSYDLAKVVRDQIGNGADLIKVYADYRWGPNGEARPTFSLEELETIVNTARSSGRDVVAHASTPEGMERAARAGVRTIEHGDGGTADVYRIMKERGVSLCPTLAAGESIMKYRGWKKGVDPDPPRILRKKESFTLALKESVDIVAGGDVGVFLHGDNARELSLMVEYGMQTQDVLKAATSENARLLNLGDVGMLAAGKLADIIAVEGNPAADISALKRVVFVMKNGIIYKNHE